MRLLLLGLLCSSAAALPTHPKHQDATIAPQSHHSHHKPTRAIAGADAEQLPFNPPPPPPPECPARCPSGKHYQPDEDAAAQCLPIKEDDTYCGCYDHEYFEKCEPCPPGTWIGDGYHRATIEHCVPAPGVSAPPPPPCAKLCPDYKHYQPAPNAAAEGHCIGDSPYDVQCGCFEFEYFNTCQPCPSGTWMGDAYHRGTIEYCKAAAEAVTTDITVEDWRQPSGAPPSASTVAEEGNMRALGGRARLEEAHHEAHMHLRRAADEPHG